MTATVTPGATGKVTFYDGVTILGVGTISSGQATFGTVMLASGSRSLHAHYSGDSVYAASDSVKVPQTVVAVTSFGFHKAVDNSGTVFPVSSVATGDFDANGKQDLAMTVPNNASVDIFLCNGDGTFATPVNYVLPYIPESVVSGDFNGDGKTDLAVSSEYPAVVGVLLGNGDGTFGAVVQYSVPFTYGNLAVADFNGDGIADLAIGGNGNSSVAVLLGNGDGSFQTATSYPAGGPVQTLVVADFNGDGKADLAAAVYPGGVGVLLGNGDGSFGSPVTVPLSGYVVTIAAADLNGDGKIDAVAGYANGVYVLLGKGDGTFQAPVSYPESNEYSDSIIISDLNGDGSPDLAVGSSYYGLSLLYGNGDGTFEPPVVYLASFGLKALAAGDFNGDGRADMIAFANTGFEILLGGAIPDLSIAVSHGGGFTEGQQSASYAITVSNAGDVATSGAVGVIASLSPNLTATSIGGTGWTCSLTGPVCTRSDALSPGSSYPVINVKVNVANTVTSLTSVFTVSGGNDQNPANNTISDTALARNSSVTTLTLSPTPASLGSPVTLTATVTAGATGSVEFLSGTAVLGSAALVSGSASFTTSLLSVGLTQLRAQYLGDANYGPSESAARVATVNAAPASGFAPFVSYKFSGSQWIGLGDFTSDGKADIVTANGSGIIVLPGNGNGTFGAASNTSFGSTFSFWNGAVVGDFNGDGKLDLVLGLNLGIYLAAGNGDGTFQSLVEIVPNQSLTYTNLVAADFNRDGKLDLVGTASGNLTLMLGNGDATFQPPVPVTTNGNYSGYLSVADLNGDGNADLIAGWPTVLLGNGDGTFQAPVSYSGIGSGGELTFALGDFNGDGLTDVAAITWDQVQVFLDSATGALQAPHSSSLAFLNGQYAVSGDFNGDGKTDIAYGGYSQNDIYLAFGNGDGTFQFASYSIGAEFTTDSDPYSMVAADFNGDGRTDLAVLTTAGYIDIFLGGQYSGLTLAASHYGNFNSGATGTYQLSIQNHTFTPTSGVVTVMDSLPNGLVATAISGSGWTCTLATLTCTRSDALNSSNGYPPITIAVNIGGLSPTTVVNHATVSNGGITNPATDPTLIVLPSTTSLNVSPNPAGMSQAVTLSATVTAGASGTVLFFDAGAPIGSSPVSGGHASFTTSLLASGQRALTAAYSGDSIYSASMSTFVSEAVSASPASGFASAATYATAAGPTEIAMGDFNGDGKPDLVTVCPSGNKISILLNNGDGTFAAHVDYAAGSAPKGVVVGDFNRDGKADLAVANINSNNVSILLGNGNGTFQPAVNYAVGNPPMTLAVGDFNTDGRIDLMVAGTSTQVATLLLGNGDGTFSAGSSINAAIAEVVLVSDFNGDGKSDILSVDSGVSVMLGNGDGTFSNPVFIPDGVVDSVAVVDLNADGKQDIVGASYGLNVLLGNGDGTFKTYTGYNSSYSATGLALADVNGDGKQDVVTPNSNNSLSIFFGNGDGTLQTPVTYPNVTSSPTGIVAGDFNGDGKTDLAITSVTGNSVTVLLGVLTPVLTVSSSHSDPFSVGQTGATYSLTVTNAGPGITSGTITVTDTLPGGITATALSGMGWTCTLATLSCQRSESLAVGQSYPVILVTVSVGVLSTAPVVNEVMASGGGAVSATSLDSTNVLGPATSFQTNPAGLSISIDGGPAFASPQTRYPLPGSHTIAVASPQAGSPGTQYVFTGWSDSGAAAHTITVGLAAASYTASFKTQYQLTANLNPTPGGTVTPASGSWFDAGSLVNLTATPNSPYVFTSWSGAASGSSASTSITMNSAQTVTALFNVPGYTCAITGDSTPSIADVQWIINEALGLAAAKDDLNHDGVVNIVDVQKLIVAVLTGQCPY